jgi:hypothetical protein
VATGGLSQDIQIKLDGGLVGVEDVVFVELGFVFDKGGVKTPV